MGKSGFEESEGGEINLDIFKEDQPKVILQELSDVDVTEHSEPIASSGFRESKRDSVSDNSSKNNSELNQVNMDQTAFLNFAAKQIPQNYSGNPLELRAFVNSIKLLKQLGPTHHDMLKTFVLTKLAGKALEVIPLEPATFDAIVNALEANIKPESTKVIEGKMMALKLDQAKSTEFTKQAEKLAESLQRSLIVEGISQEKAKSMAIEKTVEMCRQTTSSNLVRSVLASSTFKNPEEVVAKFVVETANDQKEKQILRFTQNSNRGRNNFRGRRPYYQRANNFNYNNNWRNYSKNNWRGNNFRGNRGFGRGRGRGQFSNVNDRSDNRDNRFSVRVANSGNSPVPSTSRRADQVISFQRVNES